MAVTFRRQTLAGEMLVLQLAIVVMVLLAVAAVSLAQSEATFNRVEGRRVGALAEQPAADPLVRSRLTRPVPGEALAALVNSTQTQSGVTSVTVAGPDGRTVASMNPTVIGERLPPGDGAVHGRGWSGPMTLDGSRERAAQAPVLGADRHNLGRHLGTVMIDVADPTVWQRLSGASSCPLAYLGIASGLGAAGSCLLARWVKRQSLGLEPREIAGRADPGAEPGPGALAARGHGARGEVELRHDAVSVEIAVRDSGPGAAPELDREVFSHGFTTKAAQEGDRGIGLALTRLVCERHGGETSVTDTPDGVMFTARMTVSHLADAVAEGAGR